LIPPTEDLEEPDAFELIVLADAELDCDEPKDVVPVETEPLTPEPVVVLLVFRVLLQFTNTMARGKTK